MAVRFIIICKYIGQIWCIGRYVFVITIFFILQERQRDVRKTPLTDRHCIVSKSSRKFTIDFFALANPRYDFKRKRISINR